jgi:hypothetical protein
MAVLVVSFLDTSHRAHFLGFQLSSHPCPSCDFSVFLKKKKKKKKQQLT